MNDDVRDWVVPLKFVVTQRRVSRHKEPICQFESVAYTGIMPRILESLEDDGKRFVTRTMLFGPLNQRDSDGCRCVYLNGNYPGTPLLTARG